MSSPLVNALQALRTDISKRHLDPFSLAQVRSAVSGISGYACAYERPGDARLDRLYSTVCEVLDRRPAALAFGPQEWLDAPWLASREWKGQLLCELRLFAEALEKAARSSGAVRERCVLAYLMDFDCSRVEQFALFARMIRAFLEEGLLPAWAERHQRFGLFYPETGPKTAVDALLKSSQFGPSHRQLHLAGLSGPLGAGGFSRAMLLAWCQQAHLHAENGMETLLEWDAMCTAAGHAEALAMAEALLQPWISADPCDSWRQALQSWLDTRHGDAVVNQLGADCKSVVNRWQALQVMETYFSSLDEYARQKKDDAMCRQWPYRRAFWLSAYRHGMIQKARAAVGKDIEERLGWTTLRSRFRNCVSRLEEFEAWQSALILRLPGLVAFVGAQNTSCRIWEDKSPHQPVLDADVYRRSEIIMQPRTDLHIDALATDTGLQQRGAETCVWQRKLRGFLWQRLGIFVPDAELMPE